MYVYNALDYKGTTHYSSPGRRLRYAVIGCKKNNANEGCNSCASFAGLSLQLLVVAAIILSFTASFIACFILLVIGG